MDVAPGSTGDSLVQSRVHPTDNGELSTSVLGSLGLSGCVGWTMARRADDKRHRNRRGDEDLVRIYVCIYVCVCIYIVCCCCFNH